jgi:prepilin-type N-terminal cleavage/methylation domain-containing protein
VLIAVNGEAVMDREQVAGLRAPDRQWQPGAIRVRTRWAADAALPRSQSASLTIRPCASRLFKSRAWAGTAGACSASSHCLRGDCSGAPERGFTLVELIVVIIIIGLLAAAAVLAMPEAGGGLRGEAERFAARAKGVNSYAVGTRFSAGLSLRF